MRRRILEQKKGGSYMPIFNRRHDDEGWLQAGCLQIRRPSKLASPFFTHKNSVAFRHFIIAIKTETTTHCYLATKFQPKSKNPVKANKKVQKSRTTKSPKKATENPVKANKILTQIEEPGQKGPEKRTTKSPKKSHQKAKATERREEIKTWEPTSSSSSSRSKLFPKIQMIQKKI
jgi:hypothetical protein